MLAFPAKPTSLQCEPNKCTKNVPSEPMEVKKGPGAIAPSPPISPQCRGQDLNLHPLARTSTSSWRVCQFRHPGNSSKFRGTPAALQGEFAGTGAAFPRHRASPKPANVSTQQNAGTQSPARE